MKIKTLSDSQIKREFGIEFVNAPNLSQFGGLAPLLHFFNKVHLKERLTAACGSDRASALLQIMFGICVGAQSMEGVEEASKDPLFRRFLGKPRCATQLTRVLKKISSSELAQLHELTTAMGILEFASTSSRGLPVTFDIDATSIEKFGQQEGVAAGYLAKDQIKPCYQYLFIRNDALHSFVYGTIRDGSTHSQNAFVDYLRMLLPFFNGEWTLRIRADSGYFNEEAFSLCSEQNVGFYIKAPMSESRRRLAEYGKLVWVADPDDEGVEYASYQTNTKSGYIWREIFKRVKDKDSKELLFPSYKTYCLATNDLDMKPSRAYDFYNGRAKIENNIREMKYDYGLGQITTSSFAVNDAITQATILLYILIGHFKRNCLDQEDRRKKLATIRRQIFKLPARYLSSSRYEWGRVYSVLIEKLKFSRMMSRIKGLATLFALPLLSESS